MSWELCYYSEGFHFKIFLRARKVSGSFEKPAPGHLKPQREAFTRVYVATNFQSSFDVGGQGSPNLGRVNRSVKDNFL